MSYPGTYRIVELSDWSGDELEREKDAHIEFRRDLSGSFDFGPVKGEIQGEIELYRGLERLEFTWEGKEGKTVGFGGGWVVLKGDEGLEGRLKSHKGDSKSFVATRSKEK